MIIEGERDHRHEMVVALHSCYDVEDYSDGRLALDRAYTLLPDLILIDEQAGPSGGLDLVDSLVSDPLLKTTTPAHTRRRRDRSAPGVR
jgi:CheY-like chemotaxis protein